MAYFDSFPKILYTFDFLEGSNVIAVTNIMVRARFLSIVRNNTLVFYRYQCQDFDTPEIIAHKYYGNPNRHWIVLLANDIINPYNDWFMSETIFESYLTDLYGSLDIAKTSIHHYNKVITKTASKTGLVTIKKYEIDENTFNSLPESTTSTINLSDGSSVNIITTTEQIYGYDYEWEINQNKRNIKLIDAQYVSIIESELKVLLNG